MAFVCYCLSGVNCRVMTVKFWLLAVLLVPRCLVLVVSCWLLIGDVGYLLTFSPLLVPSSDDKIRFRQEVTSDSIILILTLHYIITLQPIYSRKHNTVTLIHTHFKIILRSLFSTMAAPLVIQLTVQNMVAAVEEALQSLTEDNIVIVHCLDNISYSTWQGQKKAGTCQSGGLWMYPIT